MCSDSLERCKPFAAFAVSWLRNTMLALTPSPLPRGEGDVLPMCLNIHVCILVGQWFAVDAVEVR
jgi:hypothetical protein